MKLSLHLFMRKIISIFAVAAIISTSVPFSPETIYADPTISSQKTVIKDYLQKSGNDHTKTSSPKRDFSSKDVSKSAQYCGNNITWSYYDGTLTLSGSGYMYDYDLPNDEAESIAPWSDYYSEITKIVVGSGITYIGEYAFSSCRYAETIELPDSIKSLGAGCFSFCFALTDFTIPSTVSVIPAGAFAGCIYLESVSIPKSVTAIGDLAFYLCEALSYVYYDGTYTEWTNITIGDSCFENSNEEQIDFTLFYISQYIEIVPSDIYVDVTDFSYDLSDAVVAYPSTYDPGDITWTSSDEDIAWVGNYTKTLYPESAGTVTLTATDENGLTATCTVHVTDSISVHVTEVDIFFDTLTIIKGTDYAMTQGEDEDYEIYPLNSDYRYLHWYSDDDSIATIDFTTGELTAVSIGETDITGYTVDGYISDTFHVVVIEAWPVQEITSLVSSISLDVGDIYYFEEGYDYSIYPSNYVNHDVIITSSNEAVAEVITGQTIYALKAGTATITITTVDGNYSTTIGVTVKDNTPYTPVTPPNDNNGDTSSDNSGGESPGNDNSDSGGTGNNSGGSSSGGNSDNNGGGSSSGGNSGGSGGGSSSGGNSGNNGGNDNSGSNGNSGQTQNNSGDPDSQNNVISVTGLRIDIDSLTLNAGDVYSLADKYSVLPVNATNTTVNWTSSDISIAAVDKNGNITAISAGTATITGTTSDGGYSATFTVTVSGSNPTTDTVEIKSITIDQNSLIMLTGSTATLKAIILPANATDKDVVWTTSDSDVVTVNQQGTLIANSNGSATITASSKSNESISYKCSVTVYSEGDALTTTSGEDGDVYVIAQDSDGVPYAVYKSNTDKKTSSITIPATITVDDVSLDVSEIAENALSGHKRLKEVTIGKNIESIKGNAFKGCKKLKKIYIQSELLDSSKVESNALKGIKNGCKIYVPEEQKKAFASWLKKKGNKKIRVLADD